MNARKSYLLFLPVIMLVLMACQMTSVTLNRTTIQGSGKKASEERQVSDIQRVSLRATGDLTIIQGSEEGLTIEADDNILPHLKSEMRGRELILGPEEGTSINPKTPIKYTLKVKELNRASVSGSGSITSESIQAQDFSASISGSGKVNFAKLDAQDVSFEISGSGKMSVDTLKGKTLQARVSGSGDYDLSGEVDRQTITISGAGNYLCGDLKSSEANVHITGSGDVKVWAGSKLDIIISGSGNVSYYGKPNVSQTVAGGGNIKSLGVHE